MRVNKYFTPMSPLFVIVFSALYSDFVCLYFTKLKNYIYCGIFIKKTSNA